MNITLKLYGGLEKYLPDTASNNQAIIETQEGLCVEQILNNIATEYSNSNCDGNCISNCDDIWWIATVW